MSARLCRESSGTCGPVTHVGHSGAYYCTTHAMALARSAGAVRAMTPEELKRLCAYGKCTITYAIPMKVAIQAQEMLQTAEKLVELSDVAGVYFVIAFLVDCNRLYPYDMAQLLEVLSSTEGAIKREVHDD